MEIDINNYDIVRMRNDLEDYYGTAMVNVSPLATVDLINLDNKSDYEILIMALEMGINLEDYYRNKRY